MDNEKKKNSELIKSRARGLGFLDCGISRAGFLEKEARQLRQWLNEERHGDMQYMANYFDKRTNPAHLLKNAKSVVSVILNYYPEQQQRSDTYRIAKYAYGKDYHFVMKRMLKDLLKFIREEIGEVNGRPFVDSAPVMDKVWGQKAGLGWIGKNTNLVSTKYGSCIFIGELIIDLELEYDEPIGDYCGNCRRCIDACPTGALTEPYRIDASRCISYLTIEKKKKIPEQFKGQYADWIFGCDICQDICPWNMKSHPPLHEELKPHPDLLSLSRIDWENLSSEHFRELFKHSAVKRIKYEGLMKNIRFLKNQEKLGNESNQ
ncbi:MAG: tRNA epoxyqueuosine(34) reductase QueG [Bacteroidales bacterium]|nr:tRNA epoxyqueuosine(34) reductase QueG [Bacteroidales bacterium]